MFSLPLLPPPTPTILSSIHPSLLKWPTWKTLALSKKSRGSCGVAERVDNKHTYVHAAPAEHAKTHTYMDTDAWNGDMLNQGLRSERLTRQKQ